MNIALAGIVILAGGESSRMGSPKALLTLSNGERLIDFHIHHAKNLNVPVMVADNGKGFCLPDSAQVIQDYLPRDDDLKNQAGKGVGALSAIVSAMQNLPIQNGYLLVVSCDSLLGADVVFEHLKHSENADVMYFKGEKDYPLVGLYHVNLLAKLTAYLDNNNRAVMKFLSQVDSKVIALPEKWRALANFNTPQEFELALKQLN